MFRPFRDTQHPISRLSPSTRSAGAVRNDPDVSAPQGRVPSAVLKIAAAYGTQTPQKLVV